MAAERHSESGVAGSSHISDPTVCHSARLTLVFSTTRGRRDTERFPVEPAEVHEQNMDAQLHL